jgi:ATP-dependent Clp protease ATP-binding subunit ClpX
VPGDQGGACSFCGKERADVERLITAGPAAMICEGCLALCREIQEEERQAFIPGRG